MKQKINVIIISGLASILLIASFIFAINYRNVNKNYFHSSGYIISNSYENGSEKINKIYFDVETAYTPAKENTYVFTNTEGKKVSVDEASFVHYENGSVMSLKKGVAIDLEDIDSKLLRYYNIFEGSVLNKKNEVYEINNLGNSIVFSKLMFKISNDKYLIAAKSIVASFAEQTVEFKDYIEIEYVNKDVIRIYNNEENYQTISSNLYLVIDNIKIDLAYKTISKNNNQYLTMADMVINSNDNIEVLPEKEEVSSDEKTEEGEGFNPSDSNSSGNGGTNNNSDISGSFDNLINSLPEEGEQIDVEDEFLQPKFKVDELVVTTLGFKKLKLTFEDESSVLFGDRTVEILENSTGKTVQSFENWEEGQQEYVVESYFGLKPDTEYTLSVVGQYKIDDTVYDRTFVSKIFKTLDIGLDVVNDYVTSDSLSFAVYKNSYSEVSGFSYDIVDKDGNLIVNNRDVVYGNSDSLIITEKNKFKPNTEYTLIIKNISYSNDVFPSELYSALNINTTVKTLKEKPFENNVNLDMTINNQKNTVTFRINGLNDVYGGIENYTYNIYNEYNELLHSIEKDDSNNLVMDIEDLDGNKIHFNVLVNFDDNEKTIVYTTNKSDSISITGVEYPKVVEFVSAKNNEDFETLKGNIVIDDSKKFIEVNNVSRFEIILKDKNGTLFSGSQQIEVEYLKISETEIALPVSFDGLYPGTDYVLYVYLKHNDKLLYLGYADASTGNVEPLYLTMQNIEQSDDDSLFDFRISLTKENSSSMHIKYLEFKLHACNSENYENCRELKEFSAIIPENQDSQSLYETLTVGDKYADVSATNFNFFLVNYIQEAQSYKVTVDGYTDTYEIPVRVNNTEKRDFGLEINPLPPTLDLKNAQPILNNEESKCAEYDLCDENLNSDTTVGYEFTMQVTANPTGAYFKNIYYDVLKLNGENWETVSSKQVIPLISGEKTVEKIFVINDDILQRGNIYKIIYYGEYGTDDNNELVESRKYESNQFVIYKQKADIIGHLSQYEKVDDKLNLKFNLKIDDKDKTLQTYTESKDGNLLVLYDAVNDKNIFPKEVKSIDGGNRAEYIFEIETHGIHVLKFKEKILDTQEEKEQVLYEQNLEEILSIDQNNINVESNGTNPGKIILTLSQNDGTSNLLNRISNAKIVGNGTTHYFEFIRNGSNLQLELNLREITENNLGEIKSGKLTLNAISLVYDSGAMVESGQIPIFVKRKNGATFEYLDVENDQFISLVKLNTSKLDFIEKSISNGGKIGYYLQSKNSMVLINKAEHYSLNIVDLNVNDVLSTDKINTVYTLNGAKLKFQVFAGDITGTQFKIILNKDGQVVEEKTWQLGETLSGDGKISAKNKNNEFEISLANIHDSEYEYSILYKDAVKNEFVPIYNEETKSSVENIKITSLKEIMLSEYSTEYKHKTWNFNEDNTDLIFEKNIKVSSKHDNSQYELKTNEILMYYVYAKNVKNNTLINLSESAELFQEFDLTIDLNSESLKDKLIGEYNIYLQPYVQVDSETIDLKPIKISDSSLYLNDDLPTFNVKHDGGMDFSVQINDQDGLLDAISNKDFIELDSKYPMVELSDNASEYIKNFSNEPQGVKAIYLALYYVNENKEEVFSGYIPITFDIISNNANGYGTKIYNLSTYFATNQLPTGNYKIKLYYSVPSAYKNIVENSISNDIIKEFYNTYGVLYKEFDFSVYNRSLLNISVLDFNTFYLLALDNPSIDLKNSIASVVYQFKTIESQIITKTITINEQNKFVVNEKTDGTTEYYLHLPIGANTYTYELKNLLIQFYDENNNLITSYSYNN